VPYLKADPKRIENLTPHIDQASSKKRIGIVWSGSTTFKGNADRAVGLEAFLGAFQLPGIQLYSLQKGPPADQLKRHKGAPIIDLAPYLDDFADAAAAIESMDLIIMTDSAVAHLGGALGKPVWVLLGATPYWLWLTERTDSPWYESMELFRQGAPDDWIGPFDAASEHLLMDV
jgi:hypothetical protein